MRDALDRYDLPFYNNSGEAIPPFAAMQVDNWKDDANDRDYFRVIKPNGSGQTFILNGPLEIAIGSDGMGTRHDGMPVRYSSGTPAVDQTWGPTSSSWDLSSSGAGFNIVGGLETIGGVTVVRVSLAGGSTRYITIKGTTGTVTRSDPTFTLAEPESVNGPVPDGTITVTNDPPINTPGGRTVYARYNVSIGTDDTDRWDTGDGGNILLHLRGLEDWVAGDDQVLDHDADGDPHWHGTGPCE